MGGLGSGNDSHNDNSSLRVAHQGLAWGLLAVGLLLVPARAEEPPIHRGPSHPLASSPGALRSRSTA